MRRKVEKSLLKGYAVGQAQGLRAIEASTGDDGQRSALREVEAASQGGAALVKRFASLDAAMLTPTMRSQYERLRGKLVERGYLRE